MKLSEIKGEAALETFSKLIEPVTAIIADDDVREYFAGGENNTERLGEFARLVTTKHRAEMVAILAALNDKTSEEYLESVTIASFMSDVMAVITDQELLGFLS